MMNRIRSWVRWTGALVGLCMLFLTVPVSAAGLPFADVPADAWYYDSVAEAYSKGILNGVSADRYNPGGKLTIAECIKLAACLSQLREQDRVTLVNGTVNWYDTYVQYALDHGIILETYKDYNQTATRAQAAVMFSRVLGVREKQINKGTRRYTDVYDENLWYYDGVYRMYRCGIMIGGDNGTFRPDDEIRRGEIAAVAVRMLNPEKRVKGEISLAWYVNVPILMYHNFADVKADYTVTGKIFRSHLEMFRQEGYTTITFADLIRYADGEDNLPEKPILLTSDDGYLGVLEIALPLLEEYAMKMSVAVIGNMIGLREEDALPHFTLEEEAEADPDGHIELISHSYGLHNASSARKGARNLGLNPNVYQKMIRLDCDTVKDIAGDENPMMNSVFVYPYGSWSKDSEALLAAEGYRATVTTAWGTAVVTPGGSLGCLPRITAEWYTTGNALLWAMRNKK